MSGEADIQMAAETFTKTSRAYYRMFLGMWTSGRAPNAIYSESELLKGAGEKEPEWDNPAQLTRINGLDSAFTSGGDRSPAVDLICGRVKGIHCVHFSLVKEIPIDPEEEKKGFAPSHQIVSNWRKHCEEMGVSPQHAGYDNSGSGKAFGHIVDMEWSPLVKKIDFGGNPSGRPINLGDDTKLVYGNRVSELWIQPKAYIRQGQISGIPTEVIQELVARQYAENQGAGKLTVEQKKKMKARIGKSPDLADAFVIAIEVAIQAGLLDSVEQKAILGRARDSFSTKKVRFRMSSKGRKVKHLRF